MTVVPLLSMLFNVFSSLCLVLLLFLSPLSFLSSVEAERMLYLLNTGNLNTAFELYERHKAELGKHDMEMVQQIGLAILNIGSKSHIPEAEVLTLFGAGISGNDKVITILEDGLKATNPKLQLVSINFLARFQNDRATGLINSAMTSPFLPIRLEAAYQLAKNRHPKAAGQIHALMQKVPPEVLPVFPQLFALCGDKNSINSIKRLFSHPDVKVRIEAVHAAAKYERDDLLPEIRRLSRYLNAGEQEAAAAALGILKDEASYERLEALSRSPQANVKIAALHALYQLGRENTKEALEKIALEGNLFAINVLGSITGSEAALRELQRSSDINIRINATLALLNLRDSCCLQTISEILLKDRRDLVFTKQHSFGKGLSAWKAVPSARQNYSSNPIGLELSLALREEILTSALQLSESAFLSIARVIFENIQNDLVPMVTQLLINLQTKDAVSLLEIHREKIGAPLIRNYCNLALFRLKEEGPYGDFLREFVADNADRELIQLRPLVPWEMRNQEEASYQLNPEDASRLLVESFEALVQAQDEQSVDTLLQAIKSVKNNNRFALAGLLMRAAH